MLAQVVIQSERKIEDHLLFWTPTRCSPLLTFLPVLRRVIGAASGALALVVRLVDEVGVAEVLGLGVSFTSDFLTALDARRFLGTADCHIRREAYRKDVRCVPSKS